MEGSRESGAKRVAKRQRGEKSGKRRRENVGGVEEVKRIWGSESKRRWSGDDDLGAGVEDVVQNLDGAGQGALAVLLLLAASARS